MKNYMKLTIMEEILNGWTFKVIDVKSSVIYKNYKKTNGMLLRIMFSSIYKIILSDHINPSCKNPKFFGVSSFCRDPGKIIINYLFNYHKKINGIIKSNY